MWSNSDIVLLFLGGAVFGGILSALVWWPLGEAYLRRRAIAAGVATWKRNEESDDPDALDFVFKK